MSSSSIPDCVSTAHLMDLLDAKPEDITSPPISLKEAEPRELIDFVVEGVDAMQEVIGTTFAFKLIADYCMHQLQGIHEQGYHHHLNELENQQSALAWARDAGHLQAMQTTLRAIQCGPQDFQAPLED
jgi:hypothetical protein